MFHRIRNAAYKIRWGLRVVGCGATLRGLSRIARIVCCRPSTSEVKLRSGGVLEYEYPTQFVPVLVLFGDYIDPEFEFLRQISKSEWVFVDVGAAIGQFTVFAAMLPCAAVHAFEPNSQNVATLRRNVARNCLAGRVTIHPVALSDHEGEATLTVAKSTFMNRVKRRTDIHGEAVSVLTLDETIKNLCVRHINVLKINVAGGEPDVLAGAVGLLSKGTVDVLILLIGESSVGWYRRLAECGFRFFFFNPREVALHEVMAGDENAVLRYRPWPARNIIAIHSSALAAGIASNVKIHSCGFES